MDCFGTAVSMSLQYGVPLEVYVNKFSHTRFEPMGLHQEPRHQHRQEHRRLHLPLAGHHVPARLPRGEQDDAAAFAGRSDRTRSRERPEPEPRPAATMAGGPSVAQGSAVKRKLAQRSREGAMRRATDTPVRSTPRSGTARPPALSLMDRVAVARCGRSPPRRRPSAASNSPRSRPTPPPATTAARSPSATATATSAITAAIAWDVREE